MSQAKKTKELQRVAITGIGGICGLGHSLNQIWSNLLEGQSGISKIESFDDEKAYPVPFAGAVKNFTLSPEILEEKEQRKYGRFIHLALQAATEALAGLNLNNDYLSYSLIIISPFFLFFHVLT